MAVVHRLGGVRVMKESTVPFVSLVWTRMKSFFSRSIGTLVYLYNLWSHFFFSVWVHNWRSSVCAWVISILLLQHFQHIFLQMIHFSFSSPSLPIMGVFLVRPIPLPDESQVCDNYEVWNNSWTRFKLCSSPYYQCHELFRTNMIHR